MSNTNKRCKPDWKDAPPWAKWLAMNFDGKWWWHETKPYFVYIDNWWIQKSKNAKYKLASKGERKLYPGWTQTLEQRPANDKEHK